MSKWVDINGYEGKYQINQFGEVRSIIYKDKGNIKVLKNRLVRGYPRVDLYINRIRKTMSIHKLVAITFLGYIEGDSRMSINHKDYNKLNNHKDNLEIITKRENSSYKEDRGKRLIGTHFNKSNKKFTARIYYNKKRYVLGNFDLEEDANIAYVEALRCIDNNLEIVEYKPIKTSNHKNIHFNKKENKWIFCKKINGFNYSRSFDTEILAIEELKSVMLRLSNGDIIEKKSNTSSFVGISKDSKNGLWKAHVGKRYIGRFLTEVEAKNSRDYSLLLLMKGEPIESIRKLYKFKLRVDKTHKRHGKQR